MLLEGASLSGHLVVLLVNLGRFALTLRVHPLATVIDLSFSDLSGLAGYEVSHCHLLLLGEEVRLSQLESL